METLSEESEDNAAALFYNLRMAWKAIADTLHDEEKSPSCAGWVDLIPCRLCNRAQLRTEDTAESLYKAASTWDIEGVGHSGSHLTWPGTAQLLEKCSFASAFKGRCST